MAKTMTQAMREKTCARCGALAGAVRYETVLWWHGGPATVPLCPPCLDALRRQEEAR